MIRGSYEPTFCRTSTKIVAYVISVHQICEEIALLPSWDRTGENLPLGLAVVNGITSADMSKALERYIIEAAEDCRNCNVERNERLDNSRCCLRNEWMW